VLGFFVTDLASARSNRGGNRENLPLRLEKSSPLRAVFPLLKDGKIRGVNGMPLRIRVTGSARADDLLAYLRSIGADARREGDAITVRRRHRVLEGEPPMQDRVELEFVLREWATRQPGTAFEVEEAA
jgi:hypothetical protein